MRKLMTVSMLVMGIWLTTVCYADKLDHEDALRLSQDGAILSSQVILNDTFQRYPKAQLLEMKLRRKHGRYIYRIDLLNQQHQVRKLKYDAGTGRLLRDEEDD